MRNWIKKNKTTIIFLFLEIALVIAAFILVYHLWVGKVNKWDALDWQLFNSFYSALETEQGQNLLNVMSHYMIGLVIFPFIYVLVIGIRIYYWAAIRRFKKQHGIPL
ncbi:hypothetical protein [Brevibacillus reuszeri]|uniref:hypothetical protein n=1 Tax=Brevibacillus reuszeri TaxID=54915 RepID=UPI0013DFBE43|nr:hypothetical protein [Brevibacillus reuszeri]